jgi:glucose-1-phosphate thymidylyltransferase
MRKGIILAGGMGTRLLPNTRAISKQLLPIYDKPTVYYPLTTLMLAGIRDILVITSPRDSTAFLTTLGTGEELGIKISYATQPSPRGIAEALLIAEEWLDGSSCCLILGDNLIHGDRLSVFLQEVSGTTDNTIFAYRVADPSQFGVVQVGQSGKIISLEEKPHHPKSNYAVPGIYFYENSAVEVVKGLQPSPRGELEITDLNVELLLRNALSVRVLGRGTAWFDTGTHDDMLTAANFVQTIQQSQGLLIGCPEEVAWRMGWITAQRLRELAGALSASGYGKYLLNEVLTTGLPPGRQRVVVHRARSGGRKS